MASLRPLPTSAALGLLSSQPPPVTLPSHLVLRQRVLSQWTLSSSCPQESKSEVKRRCVRALKDFRDLEESQVMGEPAAAAVASSSATPAAVTEGNSDIYAGIPTLPISAALAAAGSETAELNGGTCGLLDRPNKKQVHCYYVFLGFLVCCLEMMVLVSCSYLWSLAPCIKNVIRGIGCRCAYFIAVKRRILHAVLLQRRIQLSSNPSNGGLFLSFIPISLFCFYFVLKLLCKISTEILVLLSTN